MDVALPVFVLRGNCQFALASMACPLWKRTCGGGMRGRVVFGEDSGAVLCPENEDGLD